MVQGSERGSSSEGPLRQLLAETHSRVALTLEAVRDAKADLIRTEDKIDRELRTIKHDARNYEQVIGGRLELADRRTGEMERRLGEVEYSVKEVAASVAKIIEPIEQLLNFRNRLAWGGLAVVSIGTVLWVFVSPIYDVFVHRIFRQ